MQKAIFGLIGNPVGHSLSPLMHQHALKHLGIDGVYIPLQVHPGDLKQAIQLSLIHISEPTRLTLPYKEAVIPYLDDLGPEAEACQAVNLISNQQGTLIGHNVDGKAFVGSLVQAGIQPRGKAVLIGAGGAARAVAYSLSAAGVEELCLLDIQEGKAQALASYLNQHCTARAVGYVMSDEQFLNLAETAELIVNCSPQGMFPHVERSPVTSLRGLSRQIVVCDLIYNPIETRLLHMAKEQGMKVVSGIDMFVEQGALSLELWTGQRAPRNKMKAVIRDALQDSR